MRDRFKFVGSSDAFQGFLGMIVKGFVRDGSLGNLFGTSSAGASEATSSSVKWLSRPVSEGFGSWFPR